MERRVAAITEGAAPELVWLVEHPPLYTAGTSARDADVLSPRRFPIAEATPCPAEAGDLLIITYLTIHGSGVNTSPEARTTCLFQLRDPTDKPTKDTHRSRGQGMMLRGIDPDA